MRIKLRSCTATFGSRLGHQVLQGLARATKRRREDRSSRRQKIGHRRIRHTVGHGVSSASGLNESRVLYDIQVLGQGGGLESGGDKQAAYRHLSGNQELENPYACRVSERLEELCLRDVQGLVTFRFIHEITISMNSLITEIASNSSRPDRPYRASSGRRTLRRNSGRRAKPGGSAKWGSHEESEQTPELLVTRGIAPTSAGGRIVDGRQKDFLPYCAPCSWWKADWKQDELHRRNRAP